MSKKEERINKILALLEEKQNIPLKEVAKYLGVSEMTIRRDINTSAHTKQSIQLFGGYITVMNNGGNHNDYFLSEQENIKAEEKKYIARLAAALVQNNDTIFFDCGTTIPNIIKYIPDSIKFTALCYSVNVFLLLQKKANCHIILCGGQFNETNGVFSYINGDTILDVIYPTKAFISAAGVSEKGMTCFNLNEVYWKKRALQNANKKILVIDSSKFGETRSALFGQLSDIDVLVTDEIDERYQELLNKHEINLIV